MKLKKISLINFRNFEKVNFEINPFLTIIFGDNAKGKTNLLEAIFCLSWGEGFREQKKEELMMFNKNKTRVDGIYQDKDLKYQKTVYLELFQNQFKKKYLVDGVEKKLSEFIKTASNSILFSPEQLEVIRDSPEKRRDYFDTVISFYDQIYKRKINNYYQALRKRNKILETINDFSDLKESLAFWNDYLEKQAEYIFKKREEYVNFLNNNSFLDNKKFFINYKKNYLDKKKLEFFFREEVKYKKTLIGPQKDDFEIFLLEKENKKNLHLFGSRSEQRLAIFWLKINEIKFYEENFKQKPIVLLDDIFSELDFNNEKLVLGLIKNYQTVLTTTQPEVLTLVDFPKTIIKL